MTHAQISTIQIHIASHVVLVCIFSSHSRTNLKQQSSPAHITCNSNFRHVCIQVGQSANPKLEHGHPHQTLQHFAFGPGFSQTQLYKFLRSLGNYENLHSRHGCHQRGRNWSTRSAQGLSSIASNVVSYHFW
jgi:hypothetical protein